MNELSTITRASEQFPLIILNITDVGIKAALDANNLGIKVELGTVKYSSDSFISVPEDPITELNNIIAETPIANGGVSEDGRTFRFSSILNLQNETAIGSLGVYTKEGILFAVASAPTGSLLKAFGGIGLIVSFGLAMSHEAANGIKISIDRESALIIGLISQHEKAANPHPQYESQLRDINGNFFDFMNWANQIDERLKALRDKTKEMTNQIQEVITINSRKYPKIYAAAIVGMNEVDGWHNTRFFTSDPQEQIDFTNGNYLIFVQHESRIEANTVVSVHPRALNIYLSRYRLKLVPYPSLRTHYLIVRLA